jgi:hypothetical protein
MSWKNPSILRKKHVIQIDMLLQQYELLMIDMIYRWRSNLNYRNMLLLSMTRWTQTNIRYSKWNWSHNSLKTSPIPKNQSRYSRKESWMLDKNSYIIIWQLHSITKKRNGKLRWSSKKRSSRTNRGILRVIWELRLRELMLKIFWRK